MQRDEQARDVALDALVRLLPVYGRDFELTVEVVQQPGGFFSTNLQFIPRSEMGRAIQPVLAKTLMTEVQQVMKERGLHGH